MKKILNLLLVFVCVFVLIGCGSKSQKLDAPTNLKIEGTVLTWDAVENATKYRVNISGDAQLNRVIKVNSADLSTFNLERGDYSVQVQAIGDGDKYLDSDLSQTIAYKQGVEEVVTEFKEEALLNDEYIKWNGRTIYNETKA